MRKIRLWIWRARIAFTLATRNLEGRSWQSLDSIEDPVTFDKVLPTHGGAFASFSLLRRQTVLKVGFFDEALRLLEDYHYWLKFLYGGGKMAYIRRVLGKRRVHSESLTYNQDVIIPHAINALRRLLEILDPAGREAVLVRREIALAESKVSVKQGRDQLAMGDYTGAEKAFAKAYAAVPFTKGRASLDGVALVSAVDAPGNITLGSTSCSIVWLTSGNYVLTTRAKHNRDHANSMSVAS